MFTFAFFHSVISKRSVGSGKSAARSIDSKSSRRLLPYSRITRAVEIHKARSNRFVERSERVKHVVAQPSEDPALRDQHGDLDLRFVLAACPGRAGSTAVP